MEIIKKKLTIRLINSLDVKCNKRLDLFNTIITVELSSRIITFNSGERCYIKKP